MPSRRQVLAAIPSLFAGCASSPPVDRPTITPTATAPEMIDVCRVMPDPPVDPTRTEASEFVAAHEKAFVYNWLVAQNGGPDKCRPGGPGSSVSSTGVGGTTTIDIEPVQTAIVTEADVGYYIVSSCSGRAEYWCRDEGRGCAGAGRNANFVTHFVGDGRHVRIPHNWFVCHVRNDPYQASIANKNLSIPADEPGMTFRVYSFHEDATADVTLTYLDADEPILEKTYSPNVGPAVQSNVTVATGDYKLIAETDEEHTVHKFSLTDRDDAVWTGVCVYVGPDSLHVVEVATDGNIAVPEGTCYEHRIKATESGDSRS